MNGVVPLVVAEKWDVTLFGPVAEVEAYLEPVDVADAVFRDYDAEGRLLGIETDGSRVYVRALEELRATPTSWRNCREGSLTG